MFKLQDFYYVNDPNNLKVYPYNSNRADIEK